jgi:hypothetical protein
MDNLATVEQMHQPDSVDTYAIVNQEKAMALSEWRIYPYGWIELQHSPILSACQILSGNNLDIVPIAIFPNHRVVPVPRHKVPMHQMTRGRAKGNQVARFQLQLRVLADRDNVMDI